MNSFFRQFRIGQRVWMLTLGFGVVVVLFTWWMVASLQRSLTEEKMRIFSVAIALPLSRLALRQRLHRWHRRDGTVFSLLTCSGSLFLLFS